jgi:hypothetical protein
MASDPRKRQKKLAKQAAKRKEKKHALVRQENAGLGERLTAATRFPILHCWISDTIETEGMGSVLLSREFPNRHVAVVTFLVDRYCLGVKDVWAEVLPRSDYDAKYVRQLSKKIAAHDAAPADARKLIEGAAAYARSLGFAPHPEYLRALRLFGDVDAATSQATFEFGKDGQPFFIGGPYDTPARCRQIMAILTNSCGPGKFHFAVPLSGSPGDIRLLDAGEEFFEDDDFEDEDEE